MKMLVAFSFIAVTTVAALCAGHDKPIRVRVDDGSCQCAVFENSDATGEPFIVRTPGFRVKCDAEGNESCHKMCVALAQAARTEAPKIFCETVGELSSGIKPAVHFKACEDADWTYTGLTAKKAICCAGGLSVACATDALEGELEDDDMDDDEPKTADR